MLEEYLHQIRQDGFTIFQDVIPADEIAAVRRHILEAARRLADPKKLADLKVSHVSSFINHEQSFAPYLTDPRMIEVVHALLGPHFRISYTTTQINEPGNPRTRWHADWPFNQKNAGHIPAPYPDGCFHLTTLWMFSPFTSENGGTLVVPGSHRITTNPTTDMGVDPDAPYPTELLVTGRAGSVLMFDSRLWHAANHNGSSEQRVAMSIRFAPWWLNLEVLRPGSDERRRMVDETGRTESCVPSVTRQAYNRLPSDVQPLFRHWVETAREAESRLQQPSSAGGP